MWNRPSVEKNSEYLFVTLYTHYIYPSVHKQRTLFEAHIVFERIAWLRVGASTMTSSLQITPSRSLPPATIIHKREKSAEKLSSIQKIIILFLGSAVDFYADFLPVLQP